MVTVLPSLSATGEHSGRDGGKLQYSFVVILVKYFLFHLCFHLSRPNCVGCGFLVPQLGIEPVLPAVESTES